MLQRTVGVMVHIGERPLVAGTYMRDTLYRFIPTVSATTLVCARGQSEHVSV